MSDQQLKITFDDLDKTLANFKNYFEQLEAYMLNDDMTYGVVLSFCNDMLNQIENTAYANIELAKGMNWPNKVSFVEVAKKRYNKIKDFHKN